MGFFGPAIFPAVAVHPAAVQHNLSFHFAPVRSRPSSSLSSPSLSSSSSRSPAPLPLELVLAIIEHAAYADGVPHQTLLRHCALVCRAWSLPAQKLLFTTARLRSQPACDAFLAALAPTPKGRILADAVVRLRAVVDCNQPLGLSQESFALAVSRCPHLYDLDLSLYGRTSPRTETTDFSASPSTSTRIPRHAPPFTDATLSLLRAGPCVSSLSFTNFTDNTHLLNQLLSVWPSIHSLSLSGTPPSPSPSSSSPTLTSLRLNLQPPPSPALLTSLTPAPLRILTLARDPPPPTLHALLTTHAPTLRALALPSSPPPELIAACTRLRELTIEAPCALPKVCRALPGGIRHLALGVDVNTVLGPLVELVRARGALGLRAVTVLVCVPGGTVPGLGVLKMACACEGVELRVVGDVGTFRELLKGDAVPTLDDDAFPRVKSLSNLYAMRSESSSS